MDFYMVVKFAKMDADSGFLHRDTFSPGVPVLDYVSQVSRYILLYISANIYAVENFANFYMVIKFADMDSDSRFSALRQI